MMALLASPKALLAVAAVLAALGLGCWLYDAGKDAERVDAMQTTMETLRTRDEIDRDIGRLPDGAAVGRLRRDWSRD